MIAKIIFVLLLAVDLGFSLAKHGEDKGKYHFGWSLFSHAFTIILLYYAGFFND